MSILDGTHLAKKTKPSTEYSVKVQLGWFTLPVIIVWFLGAERLIEIIWYLL